MNAELGMAALERGHSTLRVDGSPGLTPGDDGNEELTLRI
jgi:hypothetical protein